MNIGDQVFFTRYSLTSGVQVRTIEELDISRGYIRLAPVNNKHFSGLAVKPTEVFTNYAEAMRVAEIARCTELTRLVNRHSKLLHKEIEVVRFDN